MPSALTARCRRRNRPRKRCYYVPLREANYWRVRVLSLCARSNENPLARPRHVRTYGHRGTSNTVWQVQAGCCAGAFAGICQRAAHGRCSRGGSEGRSVEAQGRSVRPRVRSFPARILARRPFASGGVFPGHCGLHLRSLDAASFSVAAPRKRGCCSRSKALDTSSICATGSTVPADADGIAGGPRCAVLRRFFVARATTTVGAGPKLGGGGT